VALGPAKLNVDDRVFADHLTAFLNHVAHQRSCPEA
jgi:hypothetical protein